MTMLISFQQLEEMAAVWGDDPNEIAMLSQTPEAAHHNSEAKAFVETAEEKDRVGDMDDPVTLARKV